MANGVHTLLNVSNLEKSVAWYKELGLKVKHEEQGGMAWADVLSGDSALTLFPRDGNPDATAADMEWVSGPLGRGVLLSFGVSNATKTFEKARTAMAEIDAPLEESPWGGKSFRAVDPDGYVIAFMDKFPSAPKKAKAKPKAAKAKRAPARKGKAKKARR